MGKVINLSVLRGHGAARRLLIASIRRGTQDGSLKWTLDDGVILGRRGCVRFRLSLSSRVLSVADVGSAAERRFTIPIGAEIVNLISDTASPPNWAVQMISSPIDG